MGSTHGRGDGRRRADGRRAAAAARGLEEALTNNELIMVLRNASELIMDITAVNNELILDTFKYMFEIMF